MKKILYLVIIIVIIVSSYKLYNSAIFQQTFFPEKYWLCRVQSLEKSQELLNDLRNDLALNLAAMGTIRSKDLILLSVLKEQNLSDTINDFTDGITKTIDIISKIDSASEEIGKSLIEARKQLQKYKPEAVTLSIPVTLEPVDDNHQPVYFERRTKELPTKR